MPADGSVGVLSSHGEDLADRVVQFRLETSLAALDTVIDQLPESQTGFAKAARSCHMVADQVTEAATAPADDTAHAI